MRSVRAKTFQSTWRRSSPGESARYSANSWLNPKSGERCSPATKPSTTVLATRSRWEMPAKSAGSMKRVGVRGCINYLSKKRSHECERGTQECVRHTLLRALHLLLRFGLPLEQTFQDGVRIQALGFGVEVQQNAMAQDGSGQSA